MTRLTWTRKTEHPLACGGDVLIEPRDCYTLESVLWPASTFESLRLRNVVPEPEI